MKATGIVAEFNPLHNGHAYIIDEARKRTNADAVVVAMSGNFVQRGEPALTNKWSRTKTALLSGADLVLEIPTYFCLSDAGKYASAGVSILESLGCVSEICCGCAPGDSSVIKETAELISRNKDEIAELISEQTKEGLSYPAAREKAVLSLVKDDDCKEAIGKALNDPNNVLAIEYMLSSEKSEINCITRLGAAYNDPFSSDEEYQSASGIRSLFLKLGAEAASDKVSSYVPEYCLNELKASRLMFKDDVSNYLKLTVLNADASSIDECPSGGEGLGNLIKEAAVFNGEIDDIITYAKSKRYTYTRLSRLCMQILLGIDRRKYVFEKPEYLRVLGFTEKGRELLSEVKRNELHTLPVITNINKETAEEGTVSKNMLKLDIKASDIYNLMCGNDIYENSDYKTIPVMI